MGLEVITGLLNLKGKRNYSAYSESNIHGAEAQFVKVHPTAIFEAKINPNPYDGSPIKPVKTRDMVRDEVAKIQRTADLQLVNKLLKSDIVFDLETLLSLNIKNPFNKMSAQPNVHTEAEILTFWQGKNSESDDRDYAAPIRVVQGKVVDAVSWGGHDKPIYPHLIKAL